MGHAMCVLIDKFLRVREHMHIHTHTHTPCVITKSKGDIFMMISTHSHHNCPFIRSPNDKERLANMEKRVSVLEAPTKTEVENLKTQLSSLQDRLERCVESAFYFFIPPVPNKKILQVGSEIFFNDAECIYFFGRLEGGQTMKERMEELQKRIEHLQNESPSLDSSLIKYVICHK
jgi:hypothetical protein